MPLSVPALERIIRAMRSGTCSECHSSKPLSTLFAVDGVPYCEPCANHKLEQMGPAAKQAQVTRVSDPTVCAFCNTDYGSVELPRVGGLPACQPCSEKLRSYPFPRWLRLAMVGLLLLLAAALVHGRSYFQVGKDLVLGEREIQARHYDAAAAHLETVLHTAPDSPKAILLAAEAHLLAGDPSRAYALVQGRSFEDSDLFNQVNAIFTRVGKALDKANAAGKLIEQKQWAQAAQLMHQAASEYPEMKELQQAAYLLDEAVAFEQKNYSLFLDMAEKGWKQQQDYNNATQLAAALACQYALTGDPAVRARAEQMFEQGRKLVRTPDEQKDLDEFEPRFRHRIATRQIIDKDEYDRRFRPAAQKPKGEG